MWLSEHLPLAQHYPNENVTYHETRMHVLAEITIIMQAQEVGLEVVTGCTVNAYFK